MREYLVVALDRCGRCDGTGRLHRTSAFVHLCPECDGSGKVRSEVPLVDAVRALLTEDLKGLAVGVTHDALGMMAVTYEFGQAS